MGAPAVPDVAPARRRPLVGVSARLLRVASDEKLVEHVRHGSQPAFEIVYDRHHRGILSFCRHMLGNREEAEDALQHTFMAAYKDLVGSDKDIQLRAWLYTIARNRCLSVLRARREQPSDEIELVSVDGLATEVQRRSDLQDMLRDVAALPADQRAALVLSELGDMGHDEIAAILGVPKDKVKALVFQARSSLHQSREARDTSCTEIREMLATLTGGSLRRSTLRRHLKECEGCRAFETEVKRQRRALAAVLPVVPTLGLKESALAAAFGAKAGGAAAVAGTAAATAAGGGASALVAKVLVVAAVAGGGVAGADAVRDATSPDRPVSERSAPTPPAPAAPAAAVATPEAAEDAADKAAEDKPRKSRKARRRGHTDRGKEFAKTRGKGNKRGLLGTQPGKEKSAAARQRKADRLAKGKGNERAKNRAKRVKSRRAPARRPAPKPKPTPKATPKPKPTSTPAPEPEPTPEPSRGRPEGGDTTTAPGAQP